MDVLNPVCAQLPRLNVAESMLSRVMVTSYVPFPTTTMSADDDDAVKRYSKHDSSGKDHSAPPIVRSEIWKFDGNIVLWTENVQFRVHKSCLADNSVVFKDMLSFPSVPETCETTIEGCPVVQLSDSAKDWRHVLKALYERRYVVFCLEIGVVTDDKNRSQVLRSAKETQPSRDCVHP